MRLLVYPHDLAIGGSQINAIDTAASVAALGHDVFVFGVPGPLVEYVRERGLTFLAACDSPYRPSVRRVHEIARIGRRYKIDLIHGYEWPPCMESYIGAGMAWQIPILCTVLSMSVMHFVPATVPLVMGTEALAAEARTIQRGPVWSVEPPIDTENDSPDISGEGFRREFGIECDEPLVVCVSRLAIDLKLDALVRAIDAVDSLAERSSVRLIIVGDGPAAAALAARAASVNSKHGRKLIQMSGARRDPRAAYAAADIVLGMGSSALRALSIGRCVVVQGEAGFSKTFEPASGDYFFHHGFYGVGDNNEDSSKLVEQIVGLLEDSDRRHTLGEFGRTVVLERFSLKLASEKYLSIYNEVLSAPFHRNPAELARTLWLAGRLEIKNHLPGQKKSKQRQDKRLLEAAAGRRWPPL